MSGKLKKLTEIQVESCVKMYKSGLSLEPIAKYFSVTRQAVWDLLRRRIKLRSQKRFGKNNHFYRGGKSSDDLAQNILESAIKVGSITRKNICEKCGDSGFFKDGRNKVQAHHTDYNKPLHIIWLCQKCHHEWHKNNKPIKKHNETELL